jgi:cobyrinic acid a,c-diamide synthase
VEPVGWLPRRAGWEIPERHLGLVTRQDLGGLDLDGLAVALEQTVDVDRLLALSECALPILAEVLPRPAPAGRRRVAVAHDAAFCFYYQDNLDLLAEAGAELLAFSPLRDTAIPPGVGLVYLGGGYPELHAEQLAANAAMRESLRTYQQDGGRVYAECGGLMYCGRELVDAEGRSFPMLDLLPLRTVMQKRLAALGYVTWNAQEATVLGPAGTQARGHEFHYSRLESLGALRTAALLQREGEAPREDGFIAAGLLAGYAHLHFASNPRLAESLVCGTP